MPLPLILRIFSSSKECEYVEFQTLIHVPPTVWNILTSTVYSALVYDMAKCYFCSISMHIIDDVVIVDSIFAKLQDFLRPRSIY